ncbi:MULTISPECIES: TatD family hydrolase [Sphingobacterium]|uniref:TatD family hydrolase n=1 Tax=Sphingobacterium TaxID=28453 RepID=UPI00257A1AA4|nr:MULTISPECIES: TatD family hydrolase [Sphingobacterium]
MVPQVPYIDLHTHRNYPIKERAILSVKNIALNHAEEITETDCSIGLHPWYIDGNSELALALMKGGLKQAQVLAIGECGLDKNIAIPLIQQLQVFYRQVQLAQVYRKPLIIHCVRAFQEIVSCLKKVNFNEAVVFHGYRKNWTLARQLIDQGYYLSIGGHCLNGSQDELLENISLSQLFLETDTDTTVEITTLYQYVARIRSIELEELKRALYQNYKKVFNK